MTLIYSGGRTVRSRSNTMSDEQTMPEVIEDGFGGRWVKCKARQCGLHVVRPGKVQCDCDYDPTGKIEMLESTIATLTAERDARDKQVRELVEAVDELKQHVIRPDYAEGDVALRRVVTLAAQLKQSQSDSQPQE